MLERSSQIEVYHPTLGAHFRADYPNRDDVTFMRHTMAHRSDDGSIEIGYKPVVQTRYQPTERQY